MMFSVRNIPVVLIWLLTLAAPDNGKCQILQEKKCSRHRIGFVAGYGFRKIDRYIDLTRDVHETGYYYKVDFFQLEYHYAFLQRPKWELEAVGQPQVNVTHFRHFDSLSMVSRSYELGFTAGIMARRRISNRVSLYAYLCSGPLYVPSVPTRQASGFIFSDNFFLGTSIKVNKALYFDIRPGFRHISNAGMKAPNSGINDMTLSAGVFVKL
jgi:hypothetical protein